jgi:hypothetical protein
VQLDEKLRQIAVQAIHRWTKELLSFTVRKHYYRAVLETIFIPHNLSPRVGKIRCQYYRGTFSNYVDAVRTKLDLEGELLFEPDVTDLYDEKDMIPMVCMRAMCAAVIESLIILDRWMYVRENMQEKDGYIGLHRLFDPQISPRHWAIVATRSN